LWAARALVGGGVAVNARAIGLLRDQGRFDGLQHASGLHIVGKRAEFEVVARFGNLELVKEDLREICVKVVPSMNDGERVLHHGAGHAGF